MQSQNSILEEQNFLGTLKTIATAYQEISVMKMKQTRNSIEFARNFVDTLKDVFESLKFSYPIIKKRKDDRVNKGVAKILITANARFHGDILRRIYNAFLADEHPGSEILIVGRIGKDFILQHDSSAQYKYYDIPDNNMTLQDMRKLIEDLMEYETIYVYYAQFRTVVNQEIIAAEIPSIYSLLEKEEQEEKLHKPKGLVPLYLFEPSGEVIADFMNDSVRASLTRQTLFETQLARYASRIKAMDALLHNIEDEVKVLKRERVKIIRAINNKKQLERMSGVMLWQS